MTKEIKTVALTSLKSLGGASSLFDMPVTFTRLDKTKFSLVFKVKTMKKSEWISESEGSIQELHEFDEKIKTNGISAGLQDLIDEPAKIRAKQVMKAVTGWSLEDEFIAENLLLLEDEIPGALETIIPMIGAALVHGRVGN